MNDIPETENTESEVPKVTVSESADYANCLDMLDDKPAEEVYDPLTALFDIEQTDAEIDHWSNHWKEMPEYEQKDNKPFKTVQVHFKTEADYNEFAALINQPLTVKTKSLWHPRLEITKNYLLRWIEEE